MTKNEDFTTLWELQRVDEALRTAKAACDPKQLQERIGPLAERAAARQRRHDAAAKELAALRRELALAEAELKRCETEAAGIEQRLYSGSVQNPKELDQMQQKVAAL
ncbi:MAG TPA: hypothetical protein VFK80_00560, partial [Limnochordia bacterium]|nr:hypothetical protein [Limnochordia bacterium]